MSENTLNLAEHFFSIQCEGITTGVPAYFIRFKGCNLTCGCSTKHTSEILKAGKGNTDSGSFVGDLHQTGKATWTCDSIPVWLFGEKRPYSELYDNWIKEGIVNWVRDGRVHLIWTGGEPLLLQHQIQIDQFLHWYELSAEPHNNKVYNEVETNGTQVITHKLFPKLQQINCSVKLANSGMSKEKRIVPEALKSIISHPNYWFKFVISTEDDINEIKQDFIEPFNIDPKRVILMPGLDSQEDFHERTKFCLETAKKYGYIGLTRLHISAWDKTTGV